MTTQDEILKIVNDRYDNYKPFLFIKLGVLHQLVREMVGDDEFLKFLKRIEDVNHRPVYK